MKRVAITAVTLFVLSLFAAVPAMAQQFGNCNHGHYNNNFGYRNYNNYRGYSNYNVYPGGYGGYAVPGRVVVGYRSVGGVGGYNPYGGYNSFNYGYSNFNNGYGYNGGQSFGFYYSR